MDACDADLSRGAGVAVRHHDRAHTAGGVERSTLRVQRVQDGEVAASGKPEERFDTTVDQHTSDRFETRMPQVSPQMDSRSVKTERHPCPSSFFELIQRVSPEP